MTKPSTMAATAPRERPWCRSSWPGGVACRNAGDNAPVQAGPPPARRQVRVGRALGVAGRLACALLALSVWPAAAENLAPSADFEAAFGADGLPTGWGFFQDEQGHYTVSRAEVDGHGGTLKVAGQGQYGGAYAARTLLLADRSYLAGGLLRVEGAGQATIKLDYARGETYLGSSFAGFVKAGDGWTGLRVKDKRAEYPDATHVALAVALEGDGTAWFDDVYLDQLPRFAHDVGNLAAEGTIENVRGTTALGWELFHPADAPPAKAEATAAAAHSGRAGLHLVSGGQYAVFGHEPRDADRTKRHVLTGWVRCRSGAAMLKMDFIGPDGWLGQQQSAYAPADGQWHELRVAVSFEQYPAATQFAPAVAVEGDGADADFDDLVWLAD